LEDETLHEKKRRKSIGEPDLVEKKRINCLLIFGRKREKEGPLFEQEARDAEPRWGRRRGSSLAPVPVRSHNASRRGGSDTSPGGES